MRAKKPLIGTIVGVLDGALDGVQAQLMKITNIGYTVKLLESKDTFRKGDRALVSGKNCGGDADIRQVLM